MPPARLGEVGKVGHPRLDLTAERLRARHERLLQRDGPRALSVPRLYHCGLPVVPVALSCWVSPRSINSGDKRTRARIPGRFGDRPSSDRLSAYEDIKILTVEPETSIMDVVYVSLEPALAPDEIDEIIAPLRYY